MLLVGTLMLPLAVPIVNFGVILPLPSNSVVTVDATVNLAARMSQFLVLSVQTTMIASPSGPTRRQSKSVASLLLILTPTRPFVLIALPLVPTPLLPSFLRVSSLHWLSLLLCSDSTNFPFAFP